MIVCGSLALNGTNIYDAIAVQQPCCLSNEMPTIILHTSLTIIAIVGHSVFEVGVMF